MAISDKISLEICEVPFGEKGRRHRGRKEGREEETCHSPGLVIFLFIAKTKKAGKSSPWELASPALGERMFVKKYEVLALVLTLVDHLNKTILFCFSVHFPLSH